MYSYKWSWLTAVELSIARECEPHQRVAWGWLQLHTDWCTPSLPASCTAAVSTDRAAANTIIQEITYGLFHIYINLGNLP